MKLPKNALCLVDADHECLAQAKDEDGFEMVVYSGGLIKDHWWWGDLAIDVSGMSFPKSKIPILEDHRTDLKIGFSKKPDMEPNGKLTFNNITYIDTPESQRFRETSKQGFPYEASLYAKPTIVERISDGATSKVNGMTVKGPASIWRKSVFKEASVCVFGYDSNTKATAFSDSELELEIEEVNVEKLTDDKINDEENLNMKGGNKMTLEELMKEHPEIFDQFKQSTIDDVTKKLTDEFNKEREQFKKDNETANEKNKDLESRITKMEKAEEKRNEIEAENTRRMKAEKITKQLLSASRIPQHLYDKVSSQVSYSQFVKDDELDTEAFKKAVEDEIKDWEGKGVVDGQVKGMGFKRPADETKLEAEEDDNYVKEMMSYVGEKPESEEE